MGDLSQCPRNRFNGFEWPPELSEQLMQARRNGMSMTRLAAMFGVSRTTVRNQMTRLRLPTLPSQDPPGEVPMPMERPQRSDQWAAFVPSAWRVPIPPAKTCQYPEGEERPFHFCGAPSWRGSYCRTHHIRCHQVAP